MTQLEKTKRIHLPSIAVGMVALTASFAIHAEDLTYTVESGDTLQKIAEKHLPSADDWPRIEAYNKLESQSLEVGQTLLIPTEWLKDADDEEADAAVVVNTGFPAKVNTVHGEAKLLTGKTSSAITNGSTLNEESTVRTGKNGSVNIKLTTGAMIVLLPETEVVLAPPIKIKRGSLEYSLAANEEQTLVTTAVGDIKARSARFRVITSNKGKQLNVEVLEGSVNVTQGANSRTVSAGIAIQLNADKPLAEPRQTPLRPDLTNFAKSTVNGQANFTWPAISDAAGYRVQLVSGGNNPVIVRDKTVTTPKLAWKDIAPGKYTIRFRSISEGGLEGLDAELPFTVLEPLQPPYLQTPIDGTTLNTATPWIAWSRIPDANYYVLQVSKDKTFSENVEEYTHLMTSYYRYRDALPAGDYYWRVLSVSASRVKSPYSAAKMFTIPAQQ